MIKRIISISTFVDKIVFIQTLIIKPKDKAELKFFLELAKRLGTKTATIESDADERLFQDMEKNKITPKISKHKIVATLQQIIKE
jgi:hypothetical protein